jgi:hypothetical protein
MPKDWNVFWHWLEKPVREKGAAREILCSGGVDVVSLASRDEREQPPDCEAMLDGCWSGIEVPELVHQQMARRASRARRERAAGKEPKRPEAFFDWDRSDLLSTLQDRIQGKQEGWQGGLYQRRVLVICTDEFLLDRVKVGGFLQGATFQTSFFTDVFLGLSYHDGCIPVFHFAASDGIEALELQPSFFVARYDVYPFAGPMIEEYPSRDSMIQLILKRASASQPSSQWHDYDVLAEGEVVGRILMSLAAPQDRPWMWTIGRNGDVPGVAHGFEPTREAGMAAFAKSWRYVK